MKIKRLNGLKNARLTTNRGRTVDSREFIFDQHIKDALDRDGWGKSADEGRLMLVELMSKAMAGYYMSYTEGRFLACFNLLRKDNSPSSLGRQFIHSMMYTHSNKKSLFCELSNTYRAN